MAFCSVINQSGLLGNNFLNVGPTGEGEIPAASLERLAEIGGWMKVNGESIHGTTASLFSKASWDGRSTTRRFPDGGTRIYLHVFGKPKDGVVSIEQLVTRPAKISVLGHDGAPEISGGEGAWKIRLAEGSVYPIATVLALDFTAMPEIQIDADKP